MKISETTAEETLIMAVTRKYLANKSDI